jgi:protein phosphatase 1A
MASCEVCKCLLVQGFMSSMHLHLPPPLHPPRGWRPLSRVAKLCFASDYAGLPPSASTQAILSRKGIAVTLAAYHRVYGSSSDVFSEIERVKSVGGWVDDGRVCGVLAVSRAFGDWEFKGTGLPRLLETGIERGYWDAEFAGQQKFSADPVLSTPDVTETVLTEDDEFLIVASDGLWDVLPPREAVAWARKEFRAKKDASQVAASLAGLALKRYSTDNVAVVVVDLQGGEFWSSKPKSKQQPGRKGGIFGGLFRSG